MPKGKLHSKSLKELFPRKKRDLKKTYIIVCEGTKTEPIYFNELKQHHQLAINVEVFGTGRNTLTLVEEAIKIRRNSDLQVDQTWCVFDKDSFPNDNFDNAIHKAKSQGIEVAWSNECFELWYLLHFKYLSTSTPRQIIYDSLSEHLGVDYEKNMTGIYIRLLGTQAQAMSNAEKLDKLHLEEVASKCNPRTKVHELIKELLINVST